MIPFSVKTVINTVGWGWLQTFQSSSSTSCHLSKGHIWLACKHPVSKFHSCFERQNRNNISLKFWQSLIQKKKKIEKKKRGAVSWSSVTKWHAFIPATSSLGMSLYLSQLSFALLFAFGRKRQETWNISPFFFFFFLAWQGLWRQVGERRCAIFLQPHNQQNITASLLWRDHLSLKGPKSRSSNFFEISEMKVVKGHQEHTVYYTAYSSC